MPSYPLFAVVAAVAVVAFELKVLRTGILRDRSYWVSLVICLAFMIGVDGWLTKPSAAIVHYRPSATTGLHPIWGILAEEYLYAFALLTLAMAMWDRLGKARR